MPSNFTKDLIDKILNGNKPTESQTGGTPRNPYAGMRGTGNFAWQGLNDSPRDARIDARRENWAGLDPTRGRNLVREQDPTRSANNRSADTTLQYARMADVMNNHRYFDSAVTGTVGDLAGAIQSRGYGTYQMPINTREKDAQTRNEGYEAVQRGYEMGLRNDVTRLPFETERALISDDVQRAMLEAKENLNLNISVAKYNKILELTRTNPALATFATQIFVPGAVNPDPMSIWWQNQFVSIMDEAITRHPTDRNAQIRYVFQQLASVTGMTVDALMRSLGTVGKGVVSGWEGLTGGDT